MISIVIVTIIATSLSLFAQYLVLTYLSSPLPILGSFLQLQLTGNPDIAFSMHLPGLLEPLMIGGALLLFAFFAWKSKKTTLNCLGFGMILGGALANVLDRLGDGIVTDFIRVGSFPVFNVADSFITVGVVLLLLEEVIRWKKSQITNHKS